MGSHTSIDLYIDPQNSAWCKLFIPSTYWAKAVLHSISLFTDTANHEFCVWVTNDANILAYNLRCRGKNKPTNVLSWRYKETQHWHEELPSVGDIIISGETALREAVAIPRDFSDHMSFLLIHGILHILGYDHQNDEDAENMEALEQQCFNHFHNRKKQSRIKF